VPGRQLFEFPRLLQVCRESLHGLMMPLDLPWRKANRSREQDELLSKAQRAETMANAADRLSTGHLYGL